MNSVLLIFAFFCSLTIVGNARPGADSNGLSVASQARAKLAAHLPVKILCVGDSMSEAGYNLRSVSLVLMETMRNVYGDGGQAIDGWDVAGGPPFRRPPPPGFFFTVTPVIYPGEQIRSVQASTNYYADKSFYVTSNPYNKVGLFWYSYPGGGLFSVGITNLRSQTTSLPTLKLSGYSEIPTMQYTNWPVEASGQLDLRVGGISGTNYIIGPEMANTNSGVEIFFYSQGGTGLTQWLSLGTNLLGQLWKEISPDLVIYHAKDYGPPPDLPPDRDIISSKLTAFLSTIMTITTNIVVIGTPPVGSFDGENPLQNETEKGVADANGFGFVDLYEDYPNFLQNQSFGMMRDETHPSDFGASIWADELALQLGFTAAAISAPARPVFKGVEQSGGLLKTSWSTTPGQRYQLQSKTDLTNAWIDSGVSEIANTNTLSVSNSLTIETPFRYYRIRFSQ